MGSDGESAAMGTAKAVAEAISALPAVEAVALGGSHAMGTADGESDIDLYVFTGSPIAVSDREAVLAGPAPRDLKHENIWDEADVWHDAGSGVLIEAIYWGTEWIAKLMDRVLVKHKANVGYTTSHWHTVRNALCLFDRRGWLAGLQERCRQSYPEPLRQAIVGLNWPAMTAYRDQIAKALGRGDMVSVHHRTTALLEAYFDVVFAVNRVPHPGEKRQLAMAQRLCAVLPENMAEDVGRAVQTAPGGQEDSLAAIDRLVDNLASLLKKEGLQAHGQVRSD